MNKVLICLLALLLSFFIVSELFAQAPYVYDDDLGKDSAQVETQTQDVGSYSPNKYIVMLISIMVIAAFYFLMLSLYDKELDKNKGPLKAAATQCLKFTAISGLVVLAALFAMNGFSAKYFGDFIISAIAWISVIVVIWIVYLIFTLSKI